MKFFIILLLTGCSQIEGVKNLRLDFKDEQPVIGYQIKAKSPAAIAADHRWDPKEAPEYNLDDL